MPGNLTGGADRATHVSWATVTTPRPAPGLTSTTFRLRDPGDVTPERIDGWFEAQSRGFHQARTSEDHRNHFRAHAEADDLELRGIWQDRPGLGSGAIPVATYSSYDKTLNVGAGRLLPVRMISDVTVSPTHRRQGLLRAMITEDLAEAAEQGLPLAALTVSEGSIYGRLGFGLATHRRHVEVDTTSRFALRDLADDGSIHLVEPVESWPAAQSVFAAFHERTRGSVERPQFYETILTGAFDFESGPDKKLRTAVHLDALGQPDGYVAYKPGDRKDGIRTIEVVDLVALTPAAYLRLWRFLADIDLATRVAWSEAPVDDPLPWALVDPFVVTVSKVSDVLWVRVLDVAAALEAREWGADGAVVLDVADPLGHAAGRFRVETSGGRATVSPTGDEPGVRLDADTLGALYLGGVPVGTLLAAGRLTGDPEALDAWAAMADAGPPPYCITHF
jgi:predicted acetyltransferase